MRTGAHTLVAVRRSDDLWYSTCWDPNRNPEETWKSKSPIIRNESLKFYNSFSYNCGMANHSLPEGSRVWDVAEGKWVATDFISLWY